MTLDNMTNSVNVFVTDSVATVTLNRPRVHNAWDDALGVGLERAFTALSAEKPVIAAVNGPAIGAGACLALASDIAIMSHSAYLQFRFSAIGLMPDVGATALLASAVGASRAIEIFMLAEKIGAEQCRNLGLVSRVADEAAADAQELARRLAQGPTRAYATTKSAVRRWSRQALADQLELEAELQQTLIATEDWAEGRTAFLEHRKPAFVGR